MKNGTQKDNKKFTKWDFLNLFLLSVTFITIILITVGKTNVLGSTTDWSSQHITFPEYFRVLFYKTKDLFPDFAFNLGAGQNIYNFAYYGLLSPITLVSYFLPKVNMITYLMVANSIMILLSVLIMYKYLKNHDNSSLVCLMGSFIFMCATPLLFHLHRHVMFVNYMPFLILGFIGVDKYFNKHRSWLLIISVFLMIMTSYYYSVVGLIVLLIYGIYSYIKLNETITFKSFMIDGIKACIPLLIGVLLSGVLILPTFLVILSSRGETSVTIALKDILIPSVNLDYFLYKSYGVGLGVISVFSLVHLFFKNRENRFLAIVLGLIIIFPIFNYLFNGTMYIDAKSLIPFLPLFIITIVTFFNDLFASKVKVFPVIIITVIIILAGCLNLGGLKYFAFLETIVIVIGIICYYKTKYKFLLGVILCIISFSICLIGSKNDVLVKKEELYGVGYKTQESLINKITDKDKGIYRIINEVTPLANTNRIYNDINYYHTTLYSSTYNLGYNKFYYDVINNPIQSRNRVITSSGKNYPFLLLMGNKYMISKVKPYLGYEEYDKDGDYTVYKNDLALPVAYASNNLISLDEFNNLGYPYNQDAILKNIIVDKNINKKYKSNVKKIDLKFKQTNLSKLNIKKNKDGYTLKIKKTTSVKIPLETPLNNTLLYIHFEILESNPCSIGDSSIKINSITNKLTCDPWKYHNGNYTFDYVISTDTINSLNITMSKGTYKIKNVEFYTLDYNTLKEIKTSVDEFNFDLEHTKGDVIEGNINVTNNDSYFVISIPYDRGFNIYVDNKKIDYEPVNVDLVGFPITSGKHNIKIEYKAPGKKEGIYLSIFGFISAIGLSIYELKRKK